MGTFRGGWIATAVAIVVVLPSGIPVVRHHAPMLLAWHPMWNGSQYLILVYLACVPDHHQGGEIICIFLGLLVRNCAKMSARLSFSPTHCRAVAENAIKALVFMYHEAVSIFLGSKISQI